MKKFAPKFVLMAICAMTLGLPACEKQPGKGGGVTLDGRVETLVVSIEERQVNADSVALDTTILQRYFSPEKKVFIIYGNDDIHDDDTRTDYEGQYQFTGLYRGQYRLFAYSDCYDCAAGKEAVFQTVEATQRWQVLEVPTISILKID